jgi:hypothetical protein
MENFDMSLIPNTFNGLVSAVKALTEDDSLEFENYIPTAIFLAEQNLSRVIDGNAFTSTVSIVGSAGQNTITKPTNYIAPRKLKYKASGGTFKFPSFRTNDYIEDYWAAGETSTSMYPFGEPKYYGDNNLNSFILAPTPSSAFTYSLEYNHGVTHLSAGNQTNYFTNNIPDALFYGTIIGMAQFMKDYQTIAIWEKLYVTAIELFNNDVRRGRRDDNKYPRTKTQGENTLTGEN